MPTYILGINAFHADAAAVLLRDGEVVGALAEERLNRVKHFAGFPERAIQTLLDMAHIDVREVQHVAVGRDSKANLAQKLAFSVQNLRRISKLARQRLENRAKVRDIPQLLAAACGVAPADIEAQVHNIEHHLCHAASCFLTSPFPEAAILSIDGFGDFVSTMIGVGRGTQIEVLDRIYFPHSAGVLYSAVCQFIGFDKYGDEGKVMGLAPYGEPRFMDLMRQLILERPNGKFELGLDYFVHHSEGVDYGMDEAGNPTLSNLYSERLVEALGPPRVSGQELTARDRDLARSLQARLEEIYFHVLNDLHRRTGLDAICVAGGVALNSVANGMIFAHTPFKRFATHPAATDDGTAFGAAYAVHNLVLGRPRPAALQHAFLGNQWDDEQIAAALGRAGLRGRQVGDDELLRTTARHLADGRIVGWFQGRMEWGPRALGARSILAHPGFPGMKDLLNARIKHREPFRPFAPAVLEERTGDYFELTAPSPFMMLVSKTRAEVRDKLAAVNHHDDTGRIQTVSRADAPRYHRLIEEFAALTGVHVILNTSFNENEPIVCTPDEAIDCFLRTRMDVLCAGNWLVEKAPDGTVPRPAESR